MMGNFPGLEEEKNGMAIRRLELTCKAQIVPMGNLSAGQKSCHLCIVGLEASLTFFAR
jgi:hypothetical protein